MLDGVGDPGAFIYPLIKTFLADIPATAILETDVVAGFCLAPGKLLRALCGALFGDLGGVSDVVRHDDPFS